MLTCNTNGKINVGELLKNLNNSVMYVTLIQDMLDIQNPIDTNSVLVNGGAARDDGGGGIFIYNAARSAENDGATVLDGWVKQVLS